MTRKLCTAAAAVAIGLSTFAVGTASAGPPAEVFNDNDQVWSCFDPVRPGINDHCQNAQSQGDTGVIIVLEPDDRGPAEGISSNPKADDRPCPHDDQEGDGTWWAPGEDIWVCHHKPPVPPGRG